MRKTKIIATLGPAVNNPQIMEQLITAGMNGARVNFSHGTHESHGQMINLFKEAREKLNANIPLILDTKGPEIRTRAIEGSTVELVKGSTIVLTGEDIIGNKDVVSLTYKTLANDLNINSKILIDDGLIELNVVEKQGERLVCEILNSATLGENKGVNLPNTKVNLPSLTEKDIEDIKFGIKQGFDLIAASFIRCANDVLSIREVLKENNGSHIKIISKIENQEGVDNVNEIIEVSDGIMVARGDMGVEIPAEEVPVVQKNIIKQCLKQSKIVIIATQMLESMVVNPRPTRAEVNDVANAIYDGADAIMLSGETAKGKYPLEAVSMMNKIALKIENCIDYDKKLVNKPNMTNSTTNVTAHAACISSAELKVPCIVALTQSGYTAFNVAKFRPQSTIISITADEVVNRQLALLWGCVPYLNKNKSFINLLETSENASTSLNFAKDGDTIAIVAGTPIGKVRSTNTLIMHKIGE